MANTDSPSTLSELRAALVGALKESDSAGVQTHIDRYLNLGLQDMHQERWPWAERRAVLQTHPGYTTGTVAISLSARTTVTGTDTLWNTTVTGMGFTNARAGGKMAFAGGVEVYPVTTVTNDTSITLENRFIGDTALSGASYVYFEDEYALASDFDDVMDARFFSADETIRLVGPQEFYRLFPRNFTRRRPTHATLVELGPSGSAALRKRVLLGPAPDRTYQIPYRYQTTLLANSSAGAGQANLSAATDQPIVPLKYRMGVVYKAAARWARERQRNPDLALQFNADYESLMLRARQNSGPADDRPQWVPAINYQRRARYPAVHGGRRSAGGTAWDQMAE